MTTDFAWLRKEPWYLRLLVFLRLRKPRQVGFYFARFEDFIAEGAKHEGQ